MTERLRAIWKWLTAFVILAAASILLLMAQPPDVPILVVVSRFLTELLWTRQFVAGQSYGAILQLAFQGTILALLLWFATRLVSRMIRARLLDRTQLDEGVKFALQRMLAYVLFVFLALTSLHALGVDLGSFAVFGGALGIGLGLGFQTIAKNFVSGLIILLEQTVKVGDRVEVGNLQGDILTIRSSATRIRTNDNVIMIVPNSEFIEQRVTNITLNDRRVRIHVPFGVAYGSDPERVRALVHDIGQSHPDVLEDPTNDVIFTGFGDSSLDFELRVWTVKQVTTPRIIASQLYFSLFEAFKREGIEIPFPQQDLHLKSVTDSLVGGRLVTGVPESDSGANEKTVPRDRLPRGAE